MLFDLSISMQLTNPAFRNHTRNFCCYFDATLHAATLERFVAWPFFLPLTFYVMCYVCYFDGKE